MHKGKRERNRKIGSFLIDDRELLLVLVVNSSKVMKRLIATVDKSTDLASSKAIPLLFWPKTKTSSHSESHIDHSRP